MAGSAQGTATGAHASMEQKKNRRNLAFAGVQSCSSSVQMGLPLEAFSVTAVGCTFMEMARGGFRAEGKAFYLPTSVKFPIPKQWEGGAIQSSTEDRQNKCVFPKPYS